MGQICFTIGWIGLPTRMCAPALQCLRNTLRRQAADSKSAWLNRVRHKSAAEGER